MATSVTFVDSRVSDPASISSGGRGSSDRYLLSPDEDDLAAMRRILAGYSDLEAITLDGGGFAGLLAGSTVSIASSWTYRAEGFTGSVPFTFVVTRTGDTGTTESVDWTVAGAGPNPATADDFVGAVLPAGTVSFAPGETSKTITVAVQADSTAEPEEGFVVTLSNASAGFVIDRVTASATIIDEVGTRFVVSIDPVAVLSNSSTLRPVFSPDGLKVAFQGYADNLVPGDTNDDPDFFVKDLMTGAVVRVSTDSVGGQADGDAQNNNDPITFSPDSSKVVFGSLASDLVLGDANGKYDIFVKNLTTGVTIRASTDAAGAEANDHSHQPMFSPDGTRVVFWSSATNLVPGDTNGKQDIFVKDLIAGGITRVSTDATGAQSNGQSDQPVFSPDGTRVAFISTATNLVPVDSNGAFGDLFIKDLVTGAITLASTDSAGVQANLSVTQPQFSPDGTKVLFSSTANNLVTGDTNSASDIFVKDLITGAVIRASTDASGGQANGGSFDASFSPDGTRVSFRSLATNLVGGDTNAASDIFVKDLTTGAIQRVSTTAGGVQGDKFSVGKSDFSPDGKRLIITSDATNLVTGDTNGFVDAFIADLNLVSVTASDAVRSEGPSGTTLFSFTVSRTGVIIHPLSVDWAVTGTGLHPADAADFGGALPSGTVFLAGSEPSTVVTVAVAGDAAIELDETFSITLSNVSANDFMLGTKTATGVIQNDDKLVATIAADAASHAEGNAGTTIFTFTVTLDHAGPFAETIDWAIAGDGANPANAADFGGTLSSGTLTFGIGETTRTISVAVTGDAVVEPDEAFKVTLASPSANVVLGTATASGTIQNDDVLLSTVSISALSAAKAEGNIGLMGFTFTVTLTGDTSVSHTVSYGVTGTGGNPAAGSDFMGGVLPFGVVSFAIGEASKTLTIDVAGDTVVEADEGFTVTLSNPSANVVLGTATATGTIQNDDVLLSTVSIAALSAARPEGNSGSTGFTFTVTLTGDTSVSHTVSYAVTGAGGNAAAGTDFAGGVLSAGVVSFGIGETSKTLTIEVTGDTVVEADEGFAVTLSNPSANVVLGTATATGTIQNDDSATVSIAAISAAKAEENSGTIPFTFKVTLSQAGLGTQTVAWTVTGTGEHAADGADFVGGVLPSGTVTFAAGETSQTITLPVQGDTVVEFDDFFVVTLSNPSPGLALGTASALGVAQNDDRAKISIAPLAASKAEGDSGTTAFTFTVSLDQASFAAQTADWSVTGTGGNAAEAADFGGVFPSGTVSFAAGETSKVVTILVTGDTAAEFNEDFAVTLSNLTFGLVLGTASATGTVLNDDKSVVSVTGGPGSKAEGNGGNGGTSAFAWTVSLDRAGVTSQTVAWAVTGSGAQAAEGADLAGGVLPFGTLTFAPGETTKTVTVDVVGDTTVEFDEGLVLTLSAPSSGLDLGTATMAGTVVNDDLSAVSIAAQSASKAEGNSGTTAFTFAVTLSEAGVISQTVDWKVTGTGANAADAADFGGALPAGTVSFAAGETSKVVTIQVAGDSVGESHESFQVSLSNLSSGLELGTATASGTILDDDGSVSIAALLAAKAEGTGGTTAFTFTVTTTGDASTTRSVAWAVTGSGASKADGADFVGGILPTGTLTFAAGETSKVLTITVNSDATVELDEGFLVSLSNPSSSLKIGTGSASGTIQNDDSLPVTVTAHDDAYVVLKGQSLTIAAASGVLFNDQSASSASLLANASHGTVQLAGTGGFGYTPTPGFTGVDSFTYHAVPGGNGVDGKAVLYVVPVNTGGASTTLDLLGLTAAEQIAATYTAFFGRAADAGGHGFWVGEFIQHLPTQGAAALFANIASSFGISAEAKALYPFLASPFTATDAQISAFLDSVYNNLFNRSSDAGGLAYWTGEIKATLQAGQFVGSVLVNIMSGAQDTTAGKDITTLMGKVAVSLEYVHEQQEHGTVWAGASDVAAATNLLRTVTSDAASVLIGVKNAEVLIANHA